MCCDLEFDRRQLERQLARRTQMRTTIACCLAISGVWLCLASDALAQKKESLPDWKPDGAVVARLGERYQDARISIRPPSGLRKANRPDPPELAARGVFSYGWTPGGVVQSTKNLSVTLTPFARPSTDALDKTVQGMQNTIQSGLEDVQFGEVQRGRFGSIEARSGTFTALIAGDRIIAYYLIGIDKSGSFSVTAMLPYSEATPEETAAMKASMLTFHRPDSAQP